MHSEWVDLKISDGTQMAAYVTKPDAPARRSVLVLQEAFGVNGHIQDLTRRVAALGYLALAPDLFHRTAPRFQLDYGDFRPALAHMKALTEAGQTADLRAAQDWLLHNGVEEVAAIGFCMGGRVAVLAAQVLPGLKAAASFYGGQLLSLSAGVSATQAPVLLVWGDRDEHIPREQRAEFAGLLRAAGKTFVECTFSDAGHGFCNDQRPSYAPEAARVAWALATAFLAA
ncbi:MAG: dienelactone hydrolase family protein [Terriglobales bacterium]